MKYKLPRPEYSSLMIDIIKREMKKQNYAPPKMSKKALQELKHVIEVIKSKGLLQDLVLKQLPDPMGYGIFLHPKAKPIPKGQLISIYAGEVVFYPQYVPDNSAYAFAPIDDMTLTKNEQAILDKKRSFSSRRLYSLNIDAEDSGNFTRFINHSEKPNVEARLLEVPKNKLGLEEAPIEVVYFAKKKIMPGEQLLVSYEDGEACYWSVLNIKPEPVFAKTFTIDEKLNLIDHRK
jgi:hypothetical protein